MSKLVAPSVSRLGLALALVAALGCASESGPSKAEIEQGKAKTRYDLGVQHMTQNQTALALREFLAAEKLDPKDPNIQLAAAEAYRRSGRFAEAEVHLRRALELDPHDQIAQLNLSGLMIQTGRFEEAIAPALALADDPTFPTPWRALVNAGWAQLQLQRYDEARRSFEQALEYKANYWPAMLNLGILEERQGRKAEALARFQQVLDSGASPAMAAETHFRMAQIYAAMGEKGRAVDHLNTVMNDRPNSEWGKRSEEYLKLLQ